MLTSFDQDVLKAFAFHATLVLVKMLLMAPLTGFARTKKKAFANPEDAKAMGGQVNMSDPDVERVRRAHLNDIENILPYVLLGFLYCLSGPKYTVALWHFRIFSISRIAHTIVYLNEVPQPARGIAFFGGVGVCASMAIQLLMATCC